MIPDGAMQTSLRDHGGHDALVYLYFCAFLRAKPDDPIPLTLSLIEIIEMRGAAFAGLWRCYKSEFGEAPLEVPA